MQLIRSRGHWIHAAALRERNAKPLGIGEEAFVGLCCKDGTVDETRFSCLVCDKDLAKGSCMGHMIRHGVDGELVKGWLAHKDGEMLRRKSGGHLYLTGRGDPSDPHPYPNGYT